MTLLLQSEQRSTASDIATQVTASGVADYLGANRFVGFTNLVTQIFRIKISQDCKELKEFQVKPGFL